MIVRMRETRVVCFDLKNPTPLVHGREYDLPKEFAAFLIHAGKAEFRPGKKLRGTRHKEVAVPVTAPRTAPKPVTSAAVMAQMRKVVRLGD